MTDKEGKIEDAPLADVIPADGPETTAPVELQEPERPESPVSTPGAAPRRRSGAAGSIAGGVLAAAIGFGVAQVVPDGWPIADTSQLESRLEEQARQIADLGARLAAQPDVAALEARLLTLETAAPPDGGNVTAQLEDLARRIDAIEGQSADGSAEVAALAAAVKALQDRVDQAPGASPGAALSAETEARLQEAEETAARLKSEAEALALAARRQAAVTRLEVALDSGLPYGAALEELGEDLPEVLLAHAETGLPTIATLRSAFPEAARAALEASLRSDMGQTWGDRVASFLRSQTGARSLTPREGNDPDAILSRAEAALQTADIELALQELALMPEAAQPALAAWRGLAETRLQAARAVKSLGERFAG